MELAPLYRRVIGLDVHQAQISACAIIEEADGSAHIEQRQFGTFQRDRRALAAWAADLHPELVVMESTGIYWKSPFAALEKAGLHTLVVNSKHVKNVPGRKTDIGDAHWLATLARAGLLRNSFIPPAKLRELRLISRQRQNLKRMLAAEKNRMHKILTDGGVRLGVVVSDIHGKSARAMIKAIIEHRPVHEILDLASKRLKASREDLFDALQGELTECHLFVLAELMDHIEDIEARVARFDERLLQGLADERNVLALLQTIPGIDLPGAAMLLVEIGTDMDAFGSADRLASWAGLCPGNDESAGKSKRPKLRKGNPYVRRLFCEFAQSAKNSESVFKLKYKALVVRRGHKRSIIAIAHKMLRIIFVMLKWGECYRDSSVDFEELSVKRNVPRWIKSMKKYGFTPAPV